MEPSNERYLTSRNAVTQCPHLSLLDGRKAGLMFPEGQGVPAPSGADTAFFRGHAQSGVLVFRSVNKALINELAAHELDTAGAR
jgi:hypothetical protein